MIAGIAVLALCTFAQNTATHPLEGVWKINYPWHLEVENGVVKPVMEMGELKVEVQGDSLIATLVTSKTTEFSTSRVMRLAAPVAAAEPVFVMRDLVTFNAGGTERQATAVSTWILKVNGDRLSGSLERKLEGVNQGHGPLPLTGSRVGS